MRWLRGGAALLPLLVLAGCGEAEKPVVEPAESKAAAKEAASRWTPEMKANYEKFYAQERKGPNGEK